MYEFWAACGRPADSCKILSILNPRLDGNRLVVDAECGYSKTEIFSDLYAEFLNLLGVDSRQQSLLFSRTCVTRCCFVDVFGHRRVGTNGRMRQI